MRGAGNPVYAANPTKHYIGGDWVDPVSTDLLWVENPATEAGIAQVAAGGAEDIDRAVMAAADAQPHFARTSPGDRRALLLRILEVYQQRAPDVSRAILDELGAPRDLAYGAQTRVATGHLRAFADAIDGLEVDFLLPNGNRVLREPIGVAGLITPWNWPIHQISLKVFAALAAGCACVLKPSETTPLNATVLAEVLDEAGVPPGVFNLVQGTGPVAGAALAAHPRLAIVSFTGSARGGTAVAEKAAGALTKVTLELGGKSPCLVFADADLETALRSTLSKVFTNAGQNCNAPTRILVQRPVYQRAKDLAGEIGGGWRIDDPQQSGDHIGPVANARQWTHVQRLIRSGVDEGATALVGGPGKPDGFAKGHFIRPTVFADVTADMAVAREEVFGPVVTMMPFDTEGDALRIANDSDYGLAAFVHSTAADRVERLRHQLQAGMVFANGADIAYGSPFGGSKASGFGREGGIFGIDEFTALKLVA